MALELNAALQRKLQGLIADAIGQANLTSYGSVSVMDFWSLMESGEQTLQSLKQEARDSITEWLGNSPVFNLVFNQVVAELDSIDVATRQSGAALTSMPGFEDAQAKAHQLVLQLMALPDQYVVSFPLSDGLASYFQNRGYGALECGTIRAAGSWHPATSSFPPVQMTTIEQECDDFFRGGLLSPTAKLPFPAPAQELPSLCVQIRVGGLITGMATEPVKRAQDELKALIGIAVATQLLTEQFGLITSAMGSKRFAQVHEMRESSWVTLAMRRGSTDVPAPISKLIFNPTVEDTYPRLESLVRLLGMPRVGARLKLAGRWIFDAWANGDSVMRFMQFAIAMEVLLQSDPGDGGLTKTLANRCAYLIATSADEREAIRKEFPKLYGLRSKIVHNGTDRFSKEEHALARRFREICGRVVAAEMRLALADVPKGD